MASTSEVRVKLTADTSQFRREMRRARRAVRLNADDRIDWSARAMLALILVNQSHGWLLVMWTVLALVASFLVASDAVLDAVERRSERKKS